MTSEFIRNSQATLRRISSTHFSIIMFRFSVFRIHFQWKAEKFFHPPRRFFLEIPKNAINSSNIAVIDRLLIPPRAHRHDIRFISRNDLNFRLAYFIVYTSDGSFLTRMYVCMWVVVAVGGVLMSFKCIKPWKSHANENITLRINYDLINIFCRKILPILSLFMQQQPASTGFSVWSIENTHIQRDDKRINSLAVLPHSSCERCMLAQHIFGKKWNRGGFLLSQSFNENSKLCFDNNNVE